MVIRGLTGKLMAATVAVIALAGIVGCAGAPASSSSSAATSSATSAVASSSRSSASSATAHVQGGLLEALGDDAVAFAQRARSELPVAAYAQYSGVSSGEPMKFDDPNDIEALFNALATAELGPEASEVRTDDYTSFWFEFANGDRFSFNFDSMAVDLPNDGSYTYYEVKGNDDLDRFAAIAKQAYNAAS